MKKCAKLFALPLALAMTATSLTGCASLLPTEEDVMPPPISQPEAAVYQTKTVELGDIQNTKYCTGTFVSTSSETMSFQLDQGTFYRFLVNKGDTVKKGDILAEAENTSIGEEIDALEESMHVSELQNDYNLARLKQSYEKSVKSLAEQKESLSDYEEAISEAKKTVAAATADLKDVKALTTSDSNPVTGESYTKDELTTLKTAAQEALDAAKAQLEEKEAALEAAEESIKNATEDLALEKQYYDMQVELVDMDVEKNEERLAELKAQLAETQLIAPFDGKITYLASLLVGDVISKDVEVLTICDPDSLVFTYNVKDEEIYDQFYSGREVSINCNGADIAGTIVQGTADVPTETLEADEESRVVYIECPEIPDAVSMGNIGGMTIVLEEEHDVIVVEAGYISSTGTGDNTKYFCYVLEDGLPAVRSLTVGISNTGAYQITSGLEVGDEIVTNY